MLRRTQINVHTQAKPQKARGSPPRAFACFIPGRRQRPSSKPSGSPGLRQRLNPAASWPCIAWFFCCVIPAYEPQALVTEP
jgi:hypothetical protein